MKVYVLEKENNVELWKYLKVKNILCTNIYSADVIIVNKVVNIRKGLDVIDIALMMGKEIICIKNRFGKEYYVCNHLIEEGAIYI